ncbi:unnamed protein product [Mycena citricolor]|uniref:Protein kinase domain-containing protein n=1 Tax=Mycena citricolor TaxID=2018698 RepID=A0AAD2HSQ2_9AGAR|nr:unnamed protein product [Mycena citricolor]
MTTLYVANSSNPMADPVAVTVQTGDDIADLKELILAEWGPRGLGLAQENIRLWKPKRKIPLVHCARVLEEYRLNLGVIATALFVTDDANLLGPRASPNNEINVIVEIMPAWQLPIGPPLDKPDEERDTIGAMNSRYRNLVRNARAPRSPSYSIKSTNYREVQGGDYPIYDGRYHHTRGMSTMAPPIHLYNPAFARFMDDAANLALEVPNQIVLATADLMRKASAIYDDEYTRRSKIRPALKNVIACGTTQLVSDDRTTPDGGVMWTMCGTDGSLGDTVALLIEEENSELGEGGCDASIQASFSMLRYWAQRNASLFLPLWPVNQTPWSRMMMFRLTDFIWLGNGAVLNDSRQCLRVARILHSLTRSLGHLHRYYAALTPSNNPEPSRFFPSPTTFLYCGAPVHFDYLEALERDSVCVTFRCCTHEDLPRSVVVKFAQTYCPEAHELLAEKGLAPQLLYCGPVDPSQDAPSYQPLKMIVMEYIDGKTVAQLQGRVPPEDCQQQLTHMLSLLHNDGYVFGDLRWPNVMVVGKDVKLIDFDWAGKEGDATYPIHLANNIVWPPGATAMGKIEKEHDIHMLKSMIDSCTQLTG